MGARYDIVKETKGVREVCCECVKSFKCKLLSSEVDDAKMLIASLSNAFGLKRVSPTSSSHKWNIISKLVYNFGGLACNFQRKKNIRYCFDFHI